jgi:hypothetical protein
MDTANAIAIGLTAAGFFHFIGKFWRKELFYDDLL